MNKRRFHRAVNRRIAAGIAKIAGFNDLPIEERWRHLNRLTLRAVVKTVKRPRPAIFPYRPNKPGDLQ